MIWTKGAHQNTKFQTFWLLTKNFTKFPFLWAFFVESIYIKFQLKRYRRVMSHDTEEWCKIWRKTDLLFQKWQEFSEFWPEHSKFLKVCTLTEKCCNVWRKTDLWFGKSHEEFGKFLPEQSKVSNLGLWWDPFFQSRKCMSLKLTEKLWLMTMKNDTKIEEELTCHEEFDEFWTEHSKNLQNWHFKSAPSDQRI